MKKKILKKILKKKKLAKKIYNPRCFLIWETVISPHPLVIYIYILFESNRKVVQINQFWSNVIQFIFIPNQ
jgi:hypothetical protein